MSRTKAELRFKALAILTGGDVGANPSAEDAEALDGYIDSEAAELNAEGVVYIDNTEAIADEIFMSFCKLVANAAADEFGGKSDFAVAAQLRNRIRVIARSQPSYEPQEAEYF